MPPNRSVNKPNTTTNKNNSNNNDDSLMSYFKQKGYSSLTTAAASRKPLVVEHSKEESETYHGDELTPLQCKQLEAKNNNHYDKRKIINKTDVSLYEDAKAFTPGTVPHSIALAFAVGIVCGIAAWLYYAILFGLLRFLWHTLPEHYMVVGHWAPQFYWLWIPLVGFVMALGVGLTVQFMGGTSCC